MKRRILSKSKVRKSIFENEKLITKIDADGKGAAEPFGKPQTMENISN
ncbi:hypothetical protein AAC978_12525 [Desulfitobacterium sp. THU1]